jgi:hypothetical protein
VQPLLLTLCAYLSLARFSRGSTDFGKVSENENVDGTSGRPSPTCADAGSWSEYPCKAKIECDDQEEDETHVI